MMIKLNYSIVVLVFTFICAHGYAQNTLLPDSNFEQALIDLGLDTLPINGEISTSTIDTISVLDVSEKQINSLSGIEDFTNLRELTCYSNQLTSLDLSQNVLLTYLFCSNNFLDTLNINQNGNLEELFCWTNNLAYLDVSNNPSLTILRCNSNNLTSINTSNNPEIRFLDCNANEITILDLSNNFKLEMLFCYTNLITHIDISQNFMLKELWCSSNQLDSLDVSNNPNLIALTSHWNNLTSLDVTNNSLLETLTCSGNMLTELDISQNPLLYFLYCQDNELECLNLKNGNNNNFTIIEAHNNSNLTCTMVDDVEYSYENWDDFDPWNIFSLECINCNTTSTYHINKDVGVKIYPNPTNDLIEIELSRIVSDLSISIFDLKGIPVSNFEEKSISRAKVAVNSSSGIYIIKIKYEDKQEIYKVVKE